MQVCLFCGGDASAPDHALHCDGRQGHREALYGDMGDVPFEVDSDTSAAAAASIDPVRLAHLEQLVYNSIKARPKTCDEVELATGLSHQTASARIRGLVLRDKIVHSGMKRLTRHNRHAVVWRVKPEEE